MQAAQTVPACRRRVPRSQGRLLVNSVSLTTPAVVKSLFDFFCCLSLNSRVLQSHAHYLSRCGVQHRHRLLASVQIASYNFHLGLLRSEHCRVNTEQFTRAVARPASLWHHSSTWISSFRVRHFPGVDPTTGNNSATLCVGVGSSQWSAIAAALSFNPMQQTWRGKLASARRWPGRAEGPFLCLLEFRSEGKEPSDFSDGGMEIKFRPWCGTNLNDINSLGMILRSARGAIGETEVTCDEQNVAIFTLPNEYGAC